MNRSVQIVLSGYDSWSRCPFSFKFTAIQIQEKGFHYGNGITVGVIKDGEFWQSYDARYVPSFELISFLREQFEQYYGENLRYLAITEPGEGILYEGTYPKQ